MLLGSKAGSTPTSSFIVTTVSVQVIKTQIEDSLDLLEITQLTKEAKEFGCAADKVTYVLARLSEVIDEAGEPLHNDDTNNMARMRSQSVTTTATA